MCGRYASTASTAELVEIFAADQVRDAAEPPRWNIAPTDPVSVICRRPAGETTAVTVATMRWGLVPNWSGGPGTMRSPLINARAETVADKPTWRRPFARRRCLIPADGYYEWISDGATRQPYYLTGADAVLAFAGVYDYWRDERYPADDPQGWLASCAIITTRASDDIGHVHERMPVICGRDLYTDWLTDDAAAPHLLHVAAQQLAGTVHARRVSTAVNSVANDGPGLIAEMAQ